MRRTYSDYIIYVDESGDHGLAPQSIDPEYPIFVLVFCIFNKAEYIRKVVPAIQQLKLEYFGHDSVVLHSSDIKRQRKPFGFLKYDDRRAAFMGSINTMIDSLPFTLIASVIHKDKHVKQYTNPVNPYDIALEFGLERTKRYLDSHEQGARTTHVVVECRGKSEDQALELTFRRLCSQKSWGDRFDIVFSKKLENLPGLQIADLVATPIGRHILRPEQHNRAFEIVEKKFRRNSAGVYEGWGLKRFP